MKIDLSKQKHFLVLRIILFFFATSFVLLIFLSIFSEKNQIASYEDTIKLRIGDTQIIAEIADSDEEIAGGLSGRSSLSSSSGMYFILGERRVAKFWMRNMNFPLDIIWIRNEKIVGIDKNAKVPTESGVPTYTSPGPITHVIEVNAGFSNKHKIQVGDSVVVVN